MTDKRKGKDQRRGNTASSKAKPSAAAKKRMRKGGFSPTGAKAKHQANKYDWEKTSYTEQYAPSQVPNYKPMKAAKNQVRLANQDALDEIAAQMNATRDLGQEQDQGMVSIGKGAQNMMQKPGQLTKNFDYANQQLQGMVGGLAPQQDDMQGMAGDAAALAPENAANAGLFAQLGTNTAAALAGQQSMAIDTSGNINDQLAVDTANRRASYLEQMNDALQQLREGRLDVLQKEPMAVLAQRNTLADMKFGQGMDLAGYGLQADQATGDADYRKALMKLLKGELGGGGGRGGSHAGGSGNIRQDGTADPKDKTGHGGPTGSGPGGGGSGGGYGQPGGLTGPAMPRGIRIQNQIQNQRDIIKQLQDDPNSHYGPGEWWQPGNDEEIQRHRDRIQKLKKKRRRGTKKPASGGGGKGWYQ